MANENPILTIDRDTYIAAVERIYRGRQAQGTLKDPVDFTMGAAVVFEATGNMGDIPLLWILGPARGLDPITGDPCNGSTALTDHAPKKTRKR